MRAGPGETPTLWIPEQHPEFCNGQKTNGGRDLCSRSHSRGPGLGRQHHFLPLPLLSVSNPGVSIGLVHHPNLAWLGPCLQRANLFWDEVWPSVLPLLTTSCSARHSVKFLISVLGSRFHSGERRVHLSASKRTGAGGTTHSLGAPLCPPSNSALPGNHRPVSHLLFTMLLFAKQLRY